MTEKTENEALSDIAVAGTSPDVLAEGKCYSLVIPEGYQHVEVDTDKLADNPRRLHGTVALHDAASFQAFIKEHEWDATKVYASLPAFRLVAVTNDAYKADGDEALPGWADHRAVLQLTKTPEWLHWENGNGSMMTQTAFAEHVEDGLLEIQVPAAAEMLELAQTFHANTGVAFKSSEILASGQRQLHYEESTTAKAGQKGDITIPSEFELAIMPFEGSEMYKVVARLRFRARDGVLSIGYKLTRPHDVLRSAFDTTVDNLGEAITAPVLRGTPPER